MGMDATIGRRVRDAIERLTPRITFKQFAESIQMTPDALSRAMKGERGFSTLELAAIADKVGVSMHELATGQPDPFALRLAARHTHDNGYPETDVSAENPTLETLALLYRQAYPDLGSDLFPLPERVDEIRGALGDGFPRNFANRVEAALGVDVVRVPMSTRSEFSFTLNGHRVIVLSAGTNWFHQNWTIAHELGHLAHDDHSNNETTSIGEHAANGFAAELLLPKSALALIDWQTISLSHVADLLWDWGVSTKSLDIRLEYLHLPVAPTIHNELSACSTQRFLRLHQRRTTELLSDVITERMHEAATRRFPAALLKAHMEGIESGQLLPYGLAWMLGIDPDAIDLGTLNTAPNLTIGELDSLLT